MSKPDSAAPTTTVSRLALALADMTSPKANKTNPAFRSRYATLDAILDHIRPILAKRGLGLIQLIVSQENTVGVQTIVVGPEGEHNLGTVFKPMLPESTIQQYNSTVTTLRRMTAQAVVGIATDQDDDGAAASVQPSAKKWVPNTSPAAPTAKPNA